MIPSRYRGRVDIAVNGTYWGGAIFGTLGSLLFLNVLPPSVGWRIAFLLGPVLAGVILLVRRDLPEGPRWQPRAYRGLPDSQRNLPAGGQGPGHCDLLRDRAVLRRCRPTVYGHLIGNGSDPFKLFIGYLIGAGAMVVGGVVEIVLGVAAERKALEDVARPLSVERAAAKRKRTAGLPPEGR